MDAIQFHISMLNSSGFGVRNSVSQGQLTNYHYHQEVQITCIVEGSGKLILNNEVQSIDSGDVFIIGSNSPHLITSSDAGTTKLNHKSIYFNPDFFGLLKNDSFNFENVVVFLDEAKNGAFLRREEAKSISCLLEKLKHGDLNISNLIILLEIISRFIANPNKTWISHNPQRIELNERLGQRLNAVYQFSLENFRREINLEEVAKVANLSTSRFSTVFKKHSNRSYFSFLNELRIEDACSQLRIQDRTISEIAFHAGFRNLSNFNRTFKKFKAISPIEFKRQNPFYEE